MDTPSPSATTTSALDALRDRLRAAGKEGKDLRESLTDLVMDEATRVMREMRQALATSQERAAGYMLAWEQSEKHNALLQQERGAVVAELARHRADYAEEKRDHQRIHADLLRLLDALWPTTRPGAMLLLAALHRKYVEGA